MRITFLLLFFLITEVSATPYYRFWRGYKKNAITSNLFISKLNNHFIPKMTAMSKREELANYMPALLPRSGPNQMPQYLSLNIYKSELDYKNLLSSNEGKVNKKERWKIFQKGLSSSKKVRLFTHKIRVGKAYKLLANDNIKHWRKGHTVVKVRVKRSNSESHEYKESIKKLLNGMKKYSKNNLIQLITLVSEGITYEYSLWSSRRAYNQFKNSQDYVDLISITQKDLALIEEIELKKRIQSISKGQGLWL